MDLGKNNHNTKKGLLEQQSERENASYTPVAGSSTDTSSQASNGKGKGKRASPGAPSDANPLEKGGP